MFPACRQLNRPFFDDHLVVLTSGLQIYGYKSMCRGERRAEHAVGGHPLEAGVDRRGPFSLARERRRPHVGRDASPHPLIADQAIPNHRRSGARGNRVGRRPCETRLSPVEIQDVDKRGTRHGYGVPTTHGENGNSTRPIKPGASATALLGADPAKSKRLSPEPTRDLEPEESPPGQSEEVRGSASGII